MSSSTVSGPLRSENGFVSDAGGMDVTAGDLDVVAGDVNVDAGNVNVDAGDVNVVTGDMNVDAGDVAVDVGDVNVVAGAVNAYGSGIGLGSANGPILKRVVVSVSTSEISNLAGTPKELVAAVAGKVAIPLYVCISKTATTAHADASADGDLIIQTSSGTELDRVRDGAGFVDSTLPASAYWLGAAFVLPHADAGDALQLSNDGAEYTDPGSADTAFEVELVYLETDPTPVA